MHFTVGEIDIRPGNRAQPALHIAAIDKVRPSYRVGGKSRISASRVAHILIEVSTLEDCVRENGGRYDVENRLPGRFEFDRLDDFQVNRVELVEFSDGDSRSAVQAFYHDVGNVRRRIVFEACDLIIELGAGHPSQNKIPVDTSDLRLVEQLGKS